MHNHDQNKQSSWMGRLMIFCCVLPILLIVIVLASGKLSVIPVGFIYGAGIIMIIGHILMMVSGTREPISELSQVSDKDKNDKEHDAKNNPKHSCCH